MLLVPKFKGGMGGMSSDTPFGQTAALDHCSSEHKSAKTCRKKREEKKEKKKNSQACLCASCLIRGLKSVHSPGLMKQTRSPIGQASAGRGGPVHYDRSTQESAHKPAVVQTQREERR